MTMINWTRPMLSRFIQAHDAAAKGKQTMCIFDGNEFDTGYAGYLIEYLEGEFGKIILHNLQSNV